MKEITKVINEIKSTSSRNEKIALLRRYEDLPGLKDVLWLVYNPYVRTGIKKAKLKKASPTNWDKISVDDVVNYFKKNQTGATPDVLFAVTFIDQQETEEEKELAKAIVTKDLKIGVTDKTLNKVYGEDFIPRIGCMLGTEYEKQEGTFIATEKLDGARRILVKQDNNITMYSRSGIPDDGLVEIIDEARHLPNNAVYDGELLAKGQFKDSIALRQATNSIANKKGERTGLTFNIFDMVPVDEFKKGESKYTTLNRKLLLGATLRDESISLLEDNWRRMITAFGVNYNFKHIRPVPILGIVKNEHEIMELANEIWNMGGEGIMLNEVSSKYEIKRSKNLLKVKNVQEIVLPIVDYQEGTGKYQGMLGALIANYKGMKVGIGSGMTDEQRRHFWENRHGLVGMNVEINTFGESKDQNGNVSLSCPIFKRLK